ncbi:macro domain-containing protein [Prosthecobacter sp.]|uniref:macro domain-containing protein n=1 Tax=Prosthecobacter sp. TaxID=1965333 RepID=UPI0037851712
MSELIPIRCVVGDATLPATTGLAIIAHICNDIGGWGAGFVLALSKRWKQPELQYRQWHKEGVSCTPPFALGEVQFVRVSETITVANMIGQHGIRATAKLPPIRYEAVDQALSRVGDEALQTGASVHMPRIGCGLAGGAWVRIEPLILSRLSNRGIAAIVYDFGSPPQEISKP